MASKHSLYLAMGSLFDSVSRELLGDVVASKALPRELGSTSIVLGEVGSEDVVEVVGDVAAEAAKEEGWELAKSNILGELEEVVEENLIGELVEVKLRSVLRGFLP